MESIMGGSGLAVAALLLVTVQADVRADSAELARRVKPGRIVFVTDTTGAERTGRVAAVSSAGITLEQINGSRFTVPVESIARVQRTDSLWNGFVIGAAIVPTLYGIGSAVDSSSVNWTESSTVFTGFYALIGLWCDWLRDGRSDLYRAEPRAAVSLSPVIGPRTVGARFRITF
jgi:hypothetical protein